MINLKEQVQINSDIAALLRSNIPFVSRNIQENMWQNIKDYAADRGARLARVGAQIGNTIKAKTAETVRTGIENAADYQSRMGGKYELLKTSEKLGMDPSKVQQIRRSSEKFAGRRPIHPGSGASSADVSKYYADLEDFEAGRQLQARTATAKQRDPNYARNVSEIEKQDERNERTLSGRPVTWMGGGSPFPLKTNLGSTYKEVKNTQQSATKNAEALKQERHRDVARERFDLRNMYRQYGENPNSLLNRIKIGISRNRI